MATDYDALVQRNAALEKALLNLARAANGLFLHGFNNRNKAVLRQEADRAFALADPQHAAVTAAQAALDAKTRDHK